MLSGERLRPDDALVLLKDAEFTDLLSAAHEMRMDRHPDRAVTYVVDRNVNYTNICSSGCRFCAFWRKAGDADAYVLPPPALFSKLDELVRAGGTEVLLQGGLNPDLEMSFFEEMLRDIKKNFRVHVHGFSPPELVYIASRAGLAVKEAIERLVSAGLDTIPGGGAEILSERVRSLVSPGKCTAGEWVEVMRTAHKLGMRTTATMMFGHVETMAERIEHLEHIRSLQDETAGFTAFIPWTFQWANTRINVKGVGGVGYLRMLAVSRLYLDNVDNVQASWVTQGAKVGGLALHAGANDMGGTMMEENVVRAAGAGYNMSEKELRDIITGAGFEPVRRDTLYNIRV